VGLSIAVKWVSLPILGFLMWYSWRVSADKSVDNKSVDNKSVGNKSVDNKSVGNKSVGNKSVGNKSVADESMADKSITVQRRLWWRTQVRLWRAIGIGGIGMLPMILFALPFCQTTNCPLVPTSSVFVSYGRSAELIPHFVAQVWPTTLNSNAIYLVPLALWLIGITLRAHF
jgi:hypothetical protein